MSFKHLWLPGMNIKIKAVIAFKAPTVNFSETLGCGFING